MELDLMRFKSTPYSLEGKLAIDGVFECYSLERPYIDPQYKPIPAGRYGVQLLFSPHFNRVVPHIMDVPGRTNIEIHMGNYPKDSEGCVIVGQQLGEDCIYASLIALNLLQGKLEMSKNPIYINVIDPISPGGTNETNTQPQSIPTV